MHALFQLPAPQRRSTFACFKLWVTLCMLLTAIQHPRAVKANDDVAGITPCELESIINQLVNPSPEYQLHVSALRNQLRGILGQRPLAVGQEQALTDYDYPDEDKRSVAALAAQGLLNNGKRSLATLAKNGQLPTPDPESVDAEGENHNDDKRYIGAFGRNGGYMNPYGKRNIGTLARDFQLPQNGKRNMATLARLGLLSGGNREPKRNLAAVARYNSNRMAGTAPSAATAEKKNLGALKSSPVHGAQQKRDDEEAVMLPASLFAQPYDYDTNAYYWYPSYADLDWGDFGGKAQKRFLDTSKDPELFAQSMDNNHFSSYAEDEDFADDDEINSIFASASSQQPHSADISAQKRHIGAVYRSGFMPSYRHLRSITSYGDGGGRFSRSGRARQFAEYFPPREPLRQPTAAACKPCFLSTRAIKSWGAAAGVRRRFPKYFADDLEQQKSNSLLTNSLPSAATTRMRRPPVYGTMTYFSNRSTPPRMTALHRSLRQIDPMDSYHY